MLDFVTFDGLLPTTPSGRYSTLLLLTAPFYSFSLLNWRMLRMLFGPSISVVWVANSFQGLLRMVAMNGFVLSITSFSSPELVYHPVRAVIGSERNQSLLTGSCQCLVMLLISRARSFLRELLSSTSNFYLILEVDFHVSYSYNHCISDMSFSGISTRSVHP